MSKIIGDLCINEEDLKRTASKKVKNYIQESVKHAQVEEKLRDGWEVERKFKTRTRMRKLKTSDELFEDRLWVIFYNLKFSPMNKDRNCRLEFDGYTKQIDVLARDEENVFVIECKSSINENPVNARDALNELVGYREGIQKAIRSDWGRDCGRINLVVAISSEDKRPADEEFVKTNEDKNLFLWSAREIKYIEELISQVGPIAKYQLYSVIFANKKQRRLGITLPALRSKIRGHEFYSFLIPARQLLKYAYVHHRDLLGISEASQTYQRMLRSKKLRAIARFIDDEDGYFPNSIIVNFSKGLQWNLKESVEDVSMGTITLPEYFGSAWIIDGQHRIYGAAGSEKDVLLPVLAFQNMSEIEQANLFVEINKEQTSVDSALLWDLYSDIYKNSSDEKQKIRYQTAEVAKSLENSGPLKGCIDIPSEPKDRKVKLSLTTVCSAIEKYSPWDYLKHPTDENKTPENAARLINTYFETLKSLWPEEWLKGSDGVLLSNGGFTVFMIVFQDIVRHIGYDQKSLLLANKGKEFEDLLKSRYLFPVVEYLKTDNKTQKDIISKTGRQAQKEYASVIDLKIQEFVVGFSPARIRDQQISPPQTAVTPAIPKVEEKARITEGRLREFILEKLKREFGSDKWWKQGLPGNLKSKLDEDWQDEVKRKPHLRGEKNQNERKFEHVGLGDIIHIATYGQNWEQIFEEVFGDRTYLERRIKDIAALRNPSSHARQIDDQDLEDARGSLLWLSKCIGDLSLNPYADAVK